MNTLVNKSNLSVNFEKSSIDRNILSPKIIISNAGESVRHIPHSIPMPLFENSITSSDPYHSNSEESCVTSGENSKTHFSLDTSQLRPEIKYIKGKIIQPSSPNNESSSRKIVLSKQFNIALDTQPIFSQLQFSPKETNFKRQGSRNLSFSKTHSSFNRCFNKKMHSECPTTLKVMGKKSNLNPRVFLQSSVSHLKNSYSETFTTQKLKDNKKEWVPLYPSMLDAEQKFRIRNIEPHRINVESNLYARLRNTQIKKPILKSLLIC